MTMELESKSCLELKFMDDDAGSGFIEGYPSIKNNVDHGGDLIVDGAYKNLDRLIAKGFTSVGHMNHGLPIGFIVDAKEDAKGLWVKMQYHSTPEAQAARTVAKERLAAGKEVAFSIDYYTHDSEQKTIDGKSVRVLKAIEVVGFAQLNLPMNEAATAVRAKGASGRPLADHVSAVLDAVDDVVSRFESLDSLREKGLSPTNTERLEQIKTRVDSLLAKGSTDPEPEPATEPEFADPSEISALLGAAGLSE